KVGAEDRHHVALPETPGMQGGSHPLDTVGERSVGEAAAAHPIGQGRLIREFGRPVEHERSQRDVRDLDRLTPVDHVRSLSSRLRTCEQIILYSAGLSRY